MKPARCGSTWNTLVLLHCSTRHGRHARAVSGWIHAARSPASLLGPLAEKGFPALLGIGTAYAIVFGLVEIALTAFTAGGLAYGSRYWHMPLSAQCAMWAFASACAVAGVAMAQPLIIQSTLVAKTVSARYATEGFTWSMTALLCGIGIGLAAGGLFLERAACLSCLAQPR
ncbi:MAG TPA: hypothetical protein VML57_20710 [Burkholderiales bacterium]|nr:hypothetical protein [Burkholderiales bacterium]